MPTSAASREDLPSLKDREALPNDTFTDSLIGEIIDQSADGGAELLVQNPSTRGRWIAERPDIGVSEPFPLSGRAEPYKSTFEPLAQAWRILASYGFELDPAEERTISQVRPPLVVLSTRDDC